MLGTRSGNDSRSSGWWPFKKQPATLPEERWTGSRGQGGQAPRVLVECEDTGLIWAVERLLGDAGYEVAACVGPSAEANCALEATGQCELQAGADVIINHLGSDVASGALAAATHQAYPETPVIVSARARVAGGDPAPDKTVVLQEPWQSEALVAAVDELTGWTSRARSPEE